MRRVAALVMTACFCLLPGCTFMRALPYARELEDTALVRVLGVDMSVNCIAGLTITAAAEGGGGEAPAVFAGSASTVSAAVLSLEEQGTGKVSLAYVGQLLLGESAAQRSVTEALNYALEEGTIGLDATVWVVRGSTAATAITNTNRISERLTALEIDGGLASVPLSRSVRDTAASLAEHNCAFVPALALHGSTLAPCGYAILRDGALLGYVDGGAVCGVELLLGEVVEHIVEVETSACAVAALRVTAASTTITPVFDGDLLVGLSIDCLIKGAVAELQGEANFEELRAKLEEAEHDCVLHTLSLSQGLRADYLDLRGYALLTAPWHKAAITEQWAAAFPTLVLSVKVSAQLLS